MNNVAFVLSLPHRAIALATLLALLAWTTGLPAWINIAEAANVQDFSDTLSDSDLGVDSNHTLVFTLSNAIYAGETLRVTFDPTGQAFDFTGLLATDLTLTAAGVTQVANVGACTTGTEIYPSTVDTSNDFIEYTLCPTDTVATSTVVTIDVGAANFINNPATANSYVIRLGGTSANDGDTRVAIIDDVTVTAAVETRFDFSINGVNAGVTVNTDATVTSGTSTATTVPFGILAPGTPKLMAQELRVDTNAFNGFAVTVQADQTLTAGNTATIDEFTDGTAVAVPAVWAAPTGTLGATDTYGHWGLTSDDATLAAGDTFGNALYVGNFIANPIEVFYHATSTLSTAGQGIGSTTVAYKVQVMALQEAATDYTATLTYIATPVF